ncbi:MAG TPA: spore coat protein, partial [Bacillota bacterium]|nr:spore coat protein [Bacillota bacterium]
MQRLTDRDIAYDLLYGAKSGALAYMEAVLESASPQCRDAFHSLQDEQLRSQWRVWQFLHQHEEYRTEPAERREVEGVHRRMSELCQTHQPTAVGARDEAGRGGGYGDGARYESGQEGAFRGEAGWRSDDRRGRGNEAGAAGGYAGAGTGTVGAGMGTGTYGAQSGSVDFEAGRGLPEGTRFEADRGFARGGDEAGRRYGTSGGTATGGGVSTGERERYGAGSGAG